MFFCSIIVPAEGMTPVTVFYRWSFSFCISHLRSSGKAVEECYWDGLLDSLNGHGPTLVLASLGTRFVYLVRDDFLPWSSRGEVTISTVQVVDQIQMLLMVQTVGPTTIYRLMRSYTSSPQSI